MRQFVLFCSILFFSGCCGSEVILRKVEIKTQGMIDTLEAQEFKFKLKSESGDKDSIAEVIGYRGIKLKNGSTRDTAAVAEFIPALKKFVLKIPERIDTVYINDTIQVKPTDLVLRGSNNSEKIIWIMSFILTSIIIIVYKRFANVGKSNK